jgi:signal transduction histidine kinase
LQAEIESLKRSLTEASEQQTATAEILRVISQSQTDVQPVFDAIVRNAVRLCGASHGGVYRFDGTLVHSVAQNGYTPEQLKHWRRRWPRPVTASDLVSRAIGSRSVVRIADVEKATESHEFNLDALTNVRARGVHSVITVPMFRQQEIIGAISLGHRDVDAFSDSHVDLLKTFADQAVIAIENVRLFTELQEKNGALTQAHAQVTEALEQQTATSEILGIISRSRIDVQPVFDTIVRRAAKLCGGLFGALVRFDGELVHFVAHYNFSAAALDEVRRVWPAPPSRASGSGRAILDRSVVQIPDIDLDPEYGLKRLSHAVGHRSSIYVPMLRDGLPIGVIVVARAEAGRFPDNQVELLKTFADQAVIAIENVRLFTELQTSNRELTIALDQQTATSDILRVISTSPVDVQPVFEAVARNSVRLCGGVLGAVFRFDGELMHIGALYGYSADGAEATRRAFPTRPEPRMLAARAVLSRAIVHVPDVLADPDFDYRALAATADWRSLLVVPMLRGGEVLGTVGVARAEIGPFRDQEIALLQTFADQAVIAIENVRLFNELTVRTQELTRSVGQLTALGEVGRAVSSTLDLETVLTTIVSRAVDLSGLDGGVVSEYDESSEEFVQRAVAQIGGALAQSLRGVRYQKGEGAIGRTAISREPVQVPDITVPGSYQSRVRERLIESGVRAVLAVPMIHQERLIGCLGVTRNRPGGFPAETIDLLRAFATQSALAIQNARLFQEIADKSRQLEVASQHKSEFLANMSHELRTPLNAVIGFSEVLSEGMFGQLNDKQEEYARDIYSSGQHLLSLINDILDLSKIEAGRMELELTDFNLPATLDNALTLVRERAGRRGIALGLTVDERLEQIRADERKVRQVVLNLLSNAIKFTPEGGRIEVAAIPRDGSVEVSVSDTGIGIAPEDQEKVFEEFRQVGTAAKKVEGTGLGLALSRKFVELHGGRIWVESQVGVGSTFTFTIPSGHDLR